MHRNELCRLVSNAERAFCNKTIELLSACTFEGCIPFLPLLETSRKVRACAVFFIHYWLRHFLINCVYIVNRHCIAQYIQNVCWKGSVGRAPVATSEKLSKRLEHSRTFSFSRINKVACRGRFSIVQTTLQNVV